MQCNWITWPLNWQFALVLSKWHQTSIDFYMIRFDFSHHGVEALWTCSYNHTIFGSLKFRWTIFIYQWFGSNSAWKLSIDSEACQMEKICYLLLSNRHAVLSMHNTAHGYFPTVFVEIFIDSAFNTQPKYKQTDGARARACFIASIMVDIVCTWSNRNQYILLIKIIPFSNLQCRAVHIAWSLLLWCTQYTQTTNQIKRKRVLDSGTLLFLYVNK